MLLVLTAGAVLVANAIAKRQALADAGAGVRHRRQARRTVGQPGGARTRAEGRPTT